MAIFTFSADYVDRIDKSGQAYVVDLDNYIATLDFDDDELEDDAGPSESDTSKLLPDVGQKRPPPATSEEKSSPPKSIKIEPDVPLEISSESDSSVCYYSPY